VRAADCRSLVKKANGLLTV
jgi:hypothetical protein